MKKTLALSLILLAVSGSAHARGGHARRGPDLSGTPAAELVSMMNAAGKDVELRTLAAYELLQREEKSAVTPMLAILSDASAPERLRSAVVYGIHKFNDARAIPGLLKTLEDPKYQYEAMTSLGELKAKDAVEPIIDIVLSHVMHGDEGGDDFVDHNAVLVVGAEALGKIGEVAGLRGVLPVLAQDSDYRRKVAVEAVDAICMKSGNPDILRKELQLPLMSGLIDPKSEGYDKSSDVRLEAVFSLGHLKDKSTAALLKSSCESDEDARVRYASRDALLGMGQERCDAYAPIRKFLPPELRDTGK